LIENNLQTTINNFLEVKKDCYGKLKQNILNMNNLYKGYDYTFYILDKIIKNWIAILILPFPWKRK